MVTKNSYTCGKSTISNYFLESLIMASSTYARGNYQNDIFVRQLDRSTEYFDFFIENVCYSLHVYPFMF